MNEQVLAVNRLLEAGEPDNITKADTNGYVGYEPQAIIDAMNEVFDVGGWGFEEMSTETVDNEKGTLALAQMRVWLKGVDFKPFSWGQSRVTRGDTGDAKKGAQTDAIKKALSYFSIGARAYHGLLDAKQPTNGQATRQHTAQAQALSTSPKAAQAKQEPNLAATNEAKVRALLKEYQQLVPEACTAKTWYFKVLREALRIPEGPLPESRAYTPEHVIALAQYVKAYRKEAEATQK